MAVNSDLLLSTLTHDLTMKRYDFSIVDGIDSTRQRLKVRLQLFFQDWFLNRLEGVPYYEKFLRKGPDLKEIEAILKTAILTTPLVLELLTFNLEFDNAQRILFLTFSVRTTEGGIEMQEVLS